MASNSEEAIKTATTNAFSHHASHSAHVVGTLKKLFEPLKGIGPATASLILSVYDPENVIFFSDEAYYWLCTNGEKSAIKYNVKEFEDLHTKTKALMTKLKVSAIEIEKVAFVIMKENETVSKPGPVPTADPKGKAALPGCEKKVSQAPVSNRKRGNAAGSSSMKKAGPKTPSSIGKRGRQAAVTAGDPKETSKSVSKRKADDTPKSGRSKRARA